MARIAAQELEAKVLDHVRDRTNTQNMSLTQRELFKNFVERVVVRAGGLTITLKDQSPVDLAWFRSEQRVSTQADKTGCETKLNAQLVQALVRSFIWLKWLNDGTYKTIEELARVIKLHPKVIRHRIRLAFLAPEVVGSILNGSYDAPVTIAELCSSASLSWRQQRKNGAHSRHAENPLTIGGPLQR
jgi:hypothetical protein